MIDYDGDFSHWQKQLDTAGIDFDVTNLAGATYREIDSYVKSLLAQKQKNSIVERTA